MLRNITVIALLVLLAQVNARAMLANSTIDKQDAADARMSNDGLFERVLDGRPRHRADLDGALIGKSTEMKLPKVYIGRAFIQHDRLRSVPLPTSRRAPIVDGPETRFPVVARAEGLRSVFDAFARRLRPPMLEQCVNAGSLKLSTMGIGTWSWGNKLLWGYDESMDNDLQEAFNVAVAAGINFFDTGDSYGTGALEGRAEILLGKFRSEYGNKQVQKELVFGTKLASYPWRLSGKSFENALKASSNRLQTDPVELMQLHWSTSNYAPWQEPALIDGLVRCYQQGLVKAVGASNYGPVQLRKLHRSLNERGVPLASNQVQFSLLSLEPITSGLLDVSLELGIQTIAYSPLALGLLSGKYTGNLEIDEPKLPSGPRGLLFRQILPGLAPLLRELQSVAQMRGKSVAQVAINWCICKGTIPIVGAKSAEQVKNNLGALGWRLAPSEIETLESAARAVPRGATQNIFQTK